MRKYQIRVTDTKIYEVFLSAEDREAFEDPADTALSYALEMGEGAIGFGSDVEIVEDTRDTEITEILEFSRTVT